MGELALKLVENVPGKYYVDSSCIDCDLCRLTAPQNFKRAEKSGFSFVFQAPRTPKEVTVCAQAKEECPVDAIGDDGDT
jgi:ferredoxin